jgi:hypothetical protein
VILRGSFVLRLGLAIVFIAFALMQVIDPVFFTSYLPRGLQGENALMLIYLNAALDFVLAVFILFSILPRIAPALAAAHLFGIAFTLGFNDIETAVRDFGLGMACLSLVFIHEEHIPWRQRRVLRRFFGR